MTERRDQPVSGDVIESGDVRMYGWEWSELPGTPSRSRLPRGRRRTHMAARPPE